MQNKIAVSTLNQWLLEKQSFALIDVQEQGSFSQAHIFAASSAPYSQIEHLVPKLVPNPAARIVITDATGSYIAAKAAQRLEALGYHNVHLLQGGNAAWESAGHPLFDGVFLPSKTFGELVELHYHTPRLSAVELADMQQRGEVFVLLDGRTYEEFQRFTIPGSTSCPNGELPLRVQWETLQNKTLVINCAGRTRSILGTEILRQSSLAKNVYALENGTQGWLLSGLSLQYKASNALAKVSESDDCTAKRKAALAFADRCGVQTISNEQIESWRSAPEETTYVFDVRSSEEFAISTLKSALHAPGGQLLQATDTWLAVRGARVVLLDTDQIRAPIIAGWLRQMGWNAYLLPIPVQLLHSPLASETSLQGYPLTCIGRHQLDNHLILDLRSSQAYRTSHHPGAIWAIRSTLGRHVTPGADVCLVGDEHIASLAAIDVLELGARSVHLLSDPINVNSEKILSDSECIDFVFHTLGRNEGNLDAARQYLAWETGLVERLTFTEWALYPNEWPDGCELRNSSIT